MCARAPPLPASRLEGNPGGGAVLFDRHHPGDCGAGEFEVAVTGGVAGEPGEWGAWGVRDELSRVIEKYRISLDGWGGITFSYVERDIRCGWSLQVMNAIQVAIDLRLVNREI